MLSVGGEAATLPEGHVLSFATDGIVVSMTSGETSQMRTVTAHEPTDSETEVSKELPGVVQWHPEATESSSGGSINEDNATSTADEVGEAESESGASSAICMAAREARVIVLLVLFVLIIL